MTIGQRRHTRSEFGPGPCSYSPVKRSLQGSPSAKFHNKTGRKSVVTDQNGGPGTYEILNTIQNNLKSMTIGRKSVHRIEQSVGPCDYSPDKHKVKKTARAVDFKASPTRKSPKPDRELGPGTYHHSHKDFGRQMSHVTLGERRPSREPDGPGPAHYRPEDKITSRRV